MRGLEVMTILILFSDELPSSEDWGNHMSPSVRERSYLVFWWVSSPGVRARLYTSKMVTALPDDFFHDTKSSC